jgi:hypothetical protein
MQKMPQSLLASSDLKKAAIDLRIPASIEPKLLECPIESNPMAVALGVDDHSVLVEKEPLDA